MQQFGRKRADNLTPVSIKVRVAGGCFHREHSSNAYHLIDDYFSTADLSDVHCQFEEHESGPEILVCLAVTAAGLSFGKSVIELVTAIVKARSEGIKRGDRPSEPLELIIRGHTKDGEYFEEKILRIPPEQLVTQKEIKPALTNRKSPMQKKKRRKP